MKLAPNQFADIQRRLAAIQQAVYQVEDLLIAYADRNPYTPPPKRNTTWAELYADPDAGVLQPLPVLRLGPGRDYTRDIGEEELRNMRL